MSTRYSPSRSMQTRPCGSRSRTAPGSPPPSTSSRSRAASSPPRYTSARSHVDVQLRFGSGGAHEYEVDAIQSGARARHRRTAALRRGTCRPRTPHAQRPQRRRSSSRRASRIAHHDLIAAQQEVELRRHRFCSMRPMPPRPSANACTPLVTRPDLAQALRSRCSRASTRRSRTRGGRGRAPSRGAQRTARVVRRPDQMDRDRAAARGPGGERTGARRSGAMYGGRCHGPRAHLAVGARVSKRRPIDSALWNGSGCWCYPSFGIGASMIDRARLARGRVPAIRLGIPLFDQRGGARARATAERSRTEHELLATAVELRARARAARIAALTAYVRSRVTSTTWCSRCASRSSTRTLLHYNAMDADPFQLIVARRELAAAGHQYLDALRSYANAMTVVTALRRGVVPRTALDDAP